MYTELQLIKLLEAEADRIQKLLPLLEGRLAGLPEGSLHTKGKYVYRAYYENGKQRQIIIPEGFEERKLLIRELQERRYIKKAIPILRGNLKKCRQCLNGFSPYDLQKLKKQLPDAYGDFDCSDLCLKGDIEPQAWRAAEYERNMSFPENLIYKSEGGILTRSKAEADIATKLEQYGLMFRYDEVIWVGERKVSPDFSVFHPTERRIKYWEHFGRMDSPEYAVKAMDKLCNYAHNGINMGDNLIVTWECRTRPLSFGQINACIEQYLL